MIRFASFGKAFGTHVAVTGLDLTIEGGETVALLGPNGSGKTTCLKAAAGLILPSSGQVLVDGIPASRPKARQSLSFLPQKVAFPEALTGLEVVEFYRKLRGAPAGRDREVLRFASLNGASERFVGTYSGGMVQRLGLAVAALPDSPVLLLDEPTAALDPEGLCAFYALVEKRKKQGKTVLFTSHHLGDVERLADRFAVLVGGRLAAVLSSTELASRLAERGVLRLRLDRRPENLLEALRPLSPAATWSGDELILPGPASGRPALIDAVRAAGAGILSLTADEGRLDALYSELVGGKE
ncbi:MAG: ABC transporter ATP-binding protein [Thermoanaerobaculia bacterium]|nr:putative ABC transporter ATP-binding protein YxlF [Thermoanaerobaculia bacterium]MCK6683726.1 ABC transporter ATP-binding protein [Thermoanaerobaculia bacterium]